MASGLFFYFLILIELEKQREELEKMYKDACKVKQEAQDAHERVRKQEASLKRRSLDMDRTIQRFLNKQVQKTFHIILGMKQITLHIERKQIFGAFFDTHFDTQSPTQIFKQ